MFQQIPIRPLHFAVGLGRGPGLVILIVHRPVFAVNQTVAMTFLFGIFLSAPTQPYRRPNYWVAGVLEPPAEFELIAPFGPAGGVPP